MAAEERLAGTAGSAGWPSLLQRYRQSACFLPRSLLGVRWRQPPPWYALALFVAASVVFGAPRLLPMARMTREMARLGTLEERRLQQYGSWYASARQLRATTPADATIDFVMVRPAARDIAVLAGSELQPRDVRFFDGWDAWKRRRRADFLLDDRAANAAPGPLPKPAHFVVAVDPSSEPPLRIVQPLQ